MEKRQSVKWARGRKGMSIDQQQNESTPDTRFIEACEQGDAPTVERILLEKPDFSIDVVDRMGRSALRLAVENEHLEIVEILLSRTDSAHMKEALLLAIYLGHVQIAECVLKHPRYKVISDRKFGAGSGDSFWQTATSDDAQFPPDVTPLVLATQYNRYPIVQMLLSRGERIVHPHDYYCKCNECHNKFKFDSLRHAQARLNAYKALASESYLALESVDPIYSAFELGHELRKLSRSEKYFKNEYSVLADQLSRFVVKLLDKCRGHDELDIILNKTGKPNQEKYEKLARLSLALKYEEKKFVAHPWCQQKLIEIWYSHIRKFEKMNRVNSTLIVLLYVMLLPVMSVLYAIAPTTKIGVIYRQPFVKFVGHSIPYLTFIFMIVAVSFVQETGIEKHLFNDTYQVAYLNYSAALHTFGDEIVFGPQSEQLTNMVLRSAYPIWLEYVIVVFILGFVWQELRQFVSEGVRDYFESFYNYMDIIMLGLYVASYVLRFYALFKIENSINSIQDENFWMKNDSQVIKDTIYWINNDRYYWDQYDPINLAEGLFALANVLSFTRISYLLPANQQLGPLQISLGRMLGDVSKFGVIFAMIFFAFMIGLNNLFWYYDDNVRNKTSIENHGLTNAETNFGTIDATFQSVFWQLFGIGSRDAVLLAPYQNNFTTAIGFLLFGVYSIVAIVVLLNMLIAMMSKSLEEIQIEADVEWKFSRSRLYMEYIKEGSSLPVPYNLLPTWKSLVHGIRRLCNRNEENSGSSCCRKSEVDIPELHRNSRLDALEQGTVRNHRNGASQRASIAVNPGDKLTYRMIMSRMVKRFILQQQREQQDEVSAGDFDELKQDISAFRFDVRHDIHESTELIAGLSETVHNVLTRVQKLETSFLSIQQAKGLAVQGDAIPDKQSLLSSIDVAVEAEGEAAALATDIDRISSSLAEFKNIFMTAANQATQLDVVLDDIEPEIVEDEKY